MNYYRRYVGDYLRDTARLSMLEHGAYNLLLDYYYAEERPIPGDLTEVYRMVRAIMPEERRAVVKVLSLFFTLSKDGYRHKRVDHEIEVSRTARGNGKGGGRPKTGSETETITGEETGMGESGYGNEAETETGTGHPPTTNLQPPNHQPPTTRKTGRKRPCVRLPDGFVLSERVKAWAEGKGFSKLDEHLEHFLGVARAKEYVYADWDQALMNAIRDDWAKLRVNGAEPDVSRLVRELEEEERKRAAH